MPCWSHYDGSCCPCRPGGPHADAQLLHAWKRRAAARGCAPSGALQLLPPHRRHDGRVARERAAATLHAQAELVRALLRVVPVNPSERLRDRCENDGLSAPQYLLSFLRICFPIPPSVRMHATRHTGLLSILSLQPALSCYISWHTLLQFLFRGANK